MPVIRLSLLLASLVLGGCASTHNNPKDPLEPFNRGVYQFNDTVDKAVVKPVAKGYDAVMPPPGKMMVSNFFSNLDDVVVAVNDLLQFKLVRAASDVGRVLVNTTVGLLGLIDVASQVGMEKHNEDFGQTLGYWGVGSGPYLVIPFLGPSSFRDGVGLYADHRTGVLRRIKNVRARNQLYTANIVSKRANLLDQEKVLDEAMIDPYSYLRDAYQQRRQSLIHDGNPPREKLDDTENGGAPDKASANDNDEGMQPASATTTDVVPITKSDSAEKFSANDAVTATTADVAPIVVGSAEPSAQQQPVSVYRIWLPQPEGIH